jgi:uncharacterized protein YjiK
MGQTPTPVELTVTSKVRLEIPEPSDVCLGPGETLFVVSDNGYLFQTDLQGRVIKRYDHHGYDYEAVFFHQGLVNVVEERTRKILRFDPADGALQSTNTIPYSGGRNKGFESLCFNPVRNCLVIITEKEPTLIFELGAERQVLNELELAGYPDISSAGFFGGKMWILSDEGHSLTRVDPKTYKTERIFYLPVLNPEGFFFSASGTLHVISDDAATMYTINSSAFND